MFDADRFVAAVQTEYVAGVMTHMPYIVDDSHALLAMRKATGVWKSYLWNADAGTFSRVATGLPASAVECCPQATVMDNAIAFSVVSNVPYSFAVHSFSGPSFGNLASAGLSMTAHAGFTHGNASAYTSKKVSMTRSGPATETTLYLTAGGATTSLLFRGGKHVLQVAPTQDGSFVVTLYSGQDGEQAVVVSVENGVSVSSIVLASGDRPYKAHVRDGVVFYAFSAGADFEDRQIKATSQFDIVPQIVSDWVEIVG